jgi:hypothetical protein
MLLIVIDSSRNDSKIDHEQEHEHDYDAEERSRARNDSP